MRDHVMSASPELKLCWELTNGCKHSELKGYTLQQSQIVEALLSAPPLTQTYRFVPKAIFATGERLPLVEVCQNAVAFWHKFFQDAGL